jgi:hypothetical protein
MQMIVSSTAHATGNQAHKRPSRRRDESSCAAFSASSSTFNADLFQSDIDNLPAVSTILGRFAIIGNRSLTAAGCHGAGAKLQPEVAPIAFKVTLSA